MEEDTASLLSDKLDPENPTCNQSHSRLLPHNMEIFTEIEAAEEEILLEELDWSKVGNDPKEIQIALAAQSETLNTEIIDFLLQWEEDENVNKSLPDSKRVRDTFEVLDALSQVDHDLEGVDTWITDQIERLAQVCFIFQIAFLCISQHVRDIV